jgi:hypothetical protein
LGPIGDGAFTLPDIKISGGQTKVRMHGGWPSRPSEPSKAEHPELGPVFVNDLALQSIKIKGATFPEGSVIVREKRAKAKDEKPEALAVMIKRGRGFNPDGGDWQFLLINAAGTKVRLSQKTGECLNCHQSQSKTDFVFPLK